jgi:hypothetical protein
MSVFHSIVSIVSFGSAAVLLGALIASVLRRWRQAAAMSRVVVLLGPVVLLVSATGFMALPLAFPADGPDPNVRGTVLTQGLSETLNCGAPAYLALLPGAIVWGVARWRLRASGRAG